MPLRRRRLLRLRLTADRRPARRRSPRFEVGAVDSPTNTATPAPPAAPSPSTPPPPRPRSTPAPPASPTTPPRPSPSPPASEAPASSAASTATLRAPAARRTAPRPLADGPHSFEVRATDEAANTDPTRPRAASRSTPPPPTPRSTPAPPAHQRHHPDLRLLLNEAGASFECRLDGGGYARLQLAATATGPLPDGPHSFEVRATDEAANTDPSPASRSFTVDTAAPETQIDSGPAGLQRPSPTFAFSSARRAPASSAASTAAALGLQLARATGPLADGPHSFEVRATDEAQHRPEPCLAQLHGRHRRRPRPRSTPAPRPDQRHHPELRLLLRGAGRQLRVPPRRRRLAACSSPRHRAARPTAPTASRCGPPTKPPTPTRARPPQLHGRHPAPTGQALPEGEAEGRQAIAVAVSCTEDCVVIATGKVLVWGSPRRRAAAHAARRRKARFGLRKATRQLSAGQSATLRLGPKSRKARRRLRRLVRRGRKARAAIRVSYSDRVGNSSTARETIRLRRR